MSLFSYLFGSSADSQSEDQAGEAGAFPELYNGMTLELETPEGARILTGRLSGYTPSDAAMTLERLPGGLSFPVRDVGTSVVVRGVNEQMIQFFLKGTIQESNRLMCRLKDLKVKAIPEQRHDFRLQVGAPVTMFYQSDEAQSNPEECTLVDISTGGACVESEYLHAEDEVLRLRIKLLDYAPMEFLGEIIRVTEIQPGRFRYGFLFAQLRESELTELTRTLYNIQVGNRQTWTRSEQGHW
ncbi:MAG: PilZ domain-containing protein [Ruminococcus flavefaciens]|nr:PilZ domain-containing protein [Ruminococcus flavefaciens]